MKPQISMFSNEELGDIQKLFTPKMKNKTKVLKMKLESVGNEKKQHSPTSHSDLAKFYIYFTAKCLNCLTW